MSISNDGENLIFLISQPRSGSTLLQKLLFRQPQIETDGETWLLFRYLLPYTKYRSHTVNGINDEDEAINALWQNSNLNEESHIELLKKHIISLYNVLVGDSGAKYYLDKTPRYYFLLPIIQRIFPKSKIILLQRNPLDVFCSIMDTWVGENWEKLYYHKHDLFTALEEINQCIGKNVLKVRYESLIKNEKKIIEDICSFLNIDYVSESVITQNKWRMGDKRANNTQFVLKENKEKWRKKIKSDKSRFLIQEYYLLLKERGLVTYYDYDIMDKEIRKSRLKYKINKKYGLSLFNVLNNDFTHAQIKWKKRISARL